jgi:SET domain-containing protein
LESTQDKQKSPVSDRPIVTLHDVEAAVTDLALLQQKLLPLYTAMQQVDMPSKKHIHMRSIAALGYGMPLTLECQCLEVRKSKRHGLGVFTRKSVKRGTVLTVYPVHIIVNRKTGYRDIQLDDTLIERIEAYDPQYKFLNDYDFELGHGVSIVAHPSLRSDSSLLGHMINDPCGNVFQGYTAERLYAEGRERFVQRSVLDTVPRSNCEFRADSRKYVVTVIALRDIQAGEELLVCYGPDYWLSATFGKNWQKDYPFLLEFSRRDNDTTTGKKKKKSSSC